MLADLSRKASLPFLPRFFNRFPTAVILLALITAIMMSLGVAGTDELDTYTRGSLILWLLNYAVIHLALLLPGAQRIPKVNRPLSRRQTLSHGAIFILILTGSVILIATDDNAGLLIRYLSIIFVGIGLPVWLIGRRQSRRRGNRVPEGQ